MLRLRSLVAWVKLARTVARACTVQLQFDIVHNLEAPISLTRRFPYLILGLHVACAFAALACCADVDAGRSLPDERQAALILRFTRPYGGYSY